MSSTQPLLGRLVGLDVLRGIAITQVCTTHFLWVVAMWIYGRDFEMLRISEAKSVTEGVLIWAYQSQHSAFLFFVMSGYLMAKKWFSSESPSTQEFLRDRAARTLPAAWLAVAATFLIALWGGRTFTDPLWLFVENALFLNWFRYDDSRAMMAVTWTLHAEWVFYLALPGVGWIALRLFRNSPATGIALIALLVCALLKFTSLRGAATALFFASGVIAALKENDWKPYVARVPWWPIFTFYFLLNFFYGWWYPTAAKLQQAFWNPFDTHAILFAAISTLLVLKTAQNRLQGKWWVLITAYIGKISFSIYLWHVPIIIALHTGLRWPGALDTLGRGPAIVIYTLSAIALTWIVSALSFAYIEQAYFKRKHAQSLVKSKEIVIRE